MQTNLNNMSGAILTITTEQLNAAITGADAGGSWTGPVNSVYTYTISTFLYRTR
jgi:hypothetical protein